MGYVVKALCFVVVSASSAFAAESRFVGFPMVTYTEMLYARVSPGPVASNEVQAAITACTAGLNEKDRAARAAGLVEIYRSACRATQSSSSSATIEGTIVYNPRLP